MLVKRIFDDIGRGMVFAFGLLMIHTLGCELEEFNSVMGMEAPEIISKEHRKIAQMVPLGKSTPTTIEFVAKNGSLGNIEWLAPEKLNAASINPRDFRFSAFRITVDDVAPGKTVALELSSRYFSNATEFWHYHPDQVPNWQHAQENNRIQDYPEENQFNKEEQKLHSMRQLTLLVKDGGPGDADRQENGVVTIVGGPRDSFWGYVIGTLLIRFFGAFLVLAVLALAILISGRIFIRLYRTQQIPLAKDSSSEISSKSSPPNTTESSLQIGHVEDGLEPIVDKPGVSDETVVAIALALELHQQDARRKQERLKETGNPNHSWRHAGRLQLMNQRNAVLNKNHR